MLNPTKLVSSDEMKKEEGRTKINQLFEQYAAELRLGVYLDVSKVDEFSFLGSPKLTLSLWIALGFSFWLFTLLLGLPYPLRLISFFFSYVACVASLLVQMEVIAHTTRTTILVWNLIVCCIGSAIITGGCASTALFPLVALPVVSEKFPAYGLILVWALLFLLHALHLVPPSILTPDQQTIHVVLNTLTTAVFLHSFNIRRMEAISSIIAKDNCEKEVMLKYMNSLEGALESFHR